MPKDGATCIAMIQKRIEAGDAEAMLFLGSQYYFGGCGLKKDVQKSIEFWTKAAELRSIGAHYELGHSYYKGDGVEKNEARAVECNALVGYPGYTQAFGIPVVITLGFERLKGDRFWNGIR